jgi:hypothetical protein
MGDLVWSLLKWKGPAPLSDLLIYGGRFQIYAPALLLGSSDLFTVVRKTQTSAFQHHTASYRDVKEPNVYFLYILNTRIAISII